MDIGFYLGSPSATRQKLANAETTTPPPKDDTETEAGKDDTVSVNSACATPPPASSSASIAIDTYQKENDDDWMLKMAADFKVSSAYYQMKRSKEFLILEISAVPTTYGQMQTWRTARSTSTG